MPAAVLFLGISTFLVSLTGHVLLWRRRRPRHQLPALLAIFFIVGPLWLAAFHNFFGPLSDTDWLAAALLHLAMSCGYIQLYPASQGNSPSVTILTAVHESMPLGMTEAEIRALLDTEKAFQDRIDDLVLSGLVQDGKGKLSLTDKRRTFIFPFIYYRRLLAIPEGKW